ncbi:uncharacterized protein BDZ83DRAFT_258601 [Colletotrichum acutatum]|uniref:Uncharacterized protein n=1 Tax=Glomerella acutata TaxID=27357 RepID=A0AAD8XJF7_GLOAC|nr:uncharacterized protein BDZ83DRAFT_258601 [Colletotrichum acutatum]KAK1726450.1 hypothetical protein BDZ83DRAFT_258601 [Colletotrichum acutatum]
MTPSYESILPNSFDITRTYGHIPEPQSSHGRPKRHPRRTSAKTRASLEPAFTVGHLLSSTTSCIPHPSVSQYGPDSSKYAPHSTNKTLVRARSHAPSVLISSTRTKFVAAEIVVLERDVAKVVVAFYKGPCPTRKAYFARRHRFGRNCTGILAKLPTRVQMPVGFSGDLLELLQVVAGRRDTRFALLILMVMVVPSLSGSRILDLRRCGGIGASPLMAKSKLSGVQARAKRSPRASETAKVCALLI